MSDQIKRGTGSGCRGCNPRHSGEARTIRAKEPSFGIEGNRMKIIRENSGNRAMVRWCCSNEDDAIRCDASAGQCSTKLPKAHQWVLGPEGVRCVQGCCLNPAAACGGQCTGHLCSFQNRAWNPRNSRDWWNHSLSRFSTLQQKKRNKCNCPWTDPSAGSGSLGSVSRIITTGPRTGPLPRARRDDATADDGSWPLSCLCCFRRFGCHCSANTLSRVWSGLAPRTTTRASSLQTPSRQRGSHRRTESP